MVRMLRCMRCPIRDEEEVDIAQHFHSAFSFIEGAKEAGGAVLVHCHEGKSRSVTLALAYLMRSQARSWVPLLLHSCPDLSFSIASRHHL